MLLPLGTAHTMNESVVCSSPQPSSRRHCRMHEQDMLREHRVLPSISTKATASLIAINPQAHPLLPRCFLQPARVHASQVLLYYCSILSFAHLQSILFCPLLPLPTPTPAPSHSYSCPFPLPLLPLPTPTPAPYHSCPFALWPMSNPTSAHLLCGPCSILLPSPSLYVSIAKSIHTPARRREEPQGQPPSMVRSLVRLISTVPVSRLVGPLLFLPRWPLLFRPQRLLCLNPCLCSRSCRGS